MCPSLGRWLPFFVLILLVQNCYADQGAVGCTRSGYLYSRVVGITHGDTLTLLTADKEQVKIRLADIDTPKRGQPFGRKAKGALSELVFDQDVSIQYVDTDRYGRIVGRAYVEDLYVNAEMVRRGAAWVDRKYAKDGRLFELESEAKQARRGVWSLPQAQREPPWEWRRTKHDNR